MFFELADNLDKVIKEDVVVLVEFDFESEGRQELIVDLGIVGNKNIGEELRFEGRKARVN